MLNRPRGAAASPTTVPLVERSERPRRTARRLAAAAAAAAVVAGSAAGLLVWRAQAETRYEIVVAPGQAPDGQQQPEPPRAWIESAQPPDWETLRAHAQAQRQQRDGEAGAGGAGGASGSAGSEQQTPPDQAPGTPALRLPGAHWPSYEWQDGDQTLQVFLDRSLEMAPDGDGFRFGNRASGAAGAAGAGGAGGAVGASSSGYPVFRSPSGGLMALPGGVILVLDPEWDAAAVEAFLTRNDIADAERTVLDFVPNGFVIDTDPGFPALTLANSLASQDGVEIAQPNWLVQQVLQ